MTAEELAELFHTTYERLAPRFGWNGPRVTRCAWPDLPANNQALMIATATEVLEVLEAEKPPPSIKDIRRMMLEDPKTVLELIRRDQRVRGIPEARYML